MDPSNVFPAESDRLYLQALTEAHLHDYHILQSNVEATKWSQTPPDLTLQDSLNRIRENQPSPEKPWNTRFAIMLKATDSETSKSKLIGVVGMVRDREIGYKLHPDYWGKGYMSEALKMYLTMTWEAEEYKEFDRILANADPENKESFRVLEKAGFRKGPLVKEGYTRPYLGDGSKSDLQEFCLLRPGVEENE